MRILAVSGSLRAASLNSAVLEAARRLAPPGITISIYGGVGDLPHFSPDLEGEANPAAVMDLRARVGQCDGLLIACPEYAHGVPGAFKNALDWLVGSVEFPEKPVALINLSARSVHAQASLREILTTMSARIVPSACITLSIPSRTFVADDIVAHPEFSAQLRAAITAFAQEAFAQEADVGAAQLSHAK
ncbi:NADPH-dependent FMN reductase [Microvirga flavescens]|uniref:NADPH-dependent FMN reductase n=1 Tax=Microvirga flavescens TaxID=2249811 RepID=UPI000DD8422E|nr:NADPH-dependent FMN reductase [Microvirga flavescens]